METDDPDYPQMSRLSRDILEMARGNMIHNPNLDPDGWV